jgi:hypothetical protein
VFIVASLQGCHDEMPAGHRLSHSRGQQLAHGGKGEDVAGLFDAMQVLLTPQNVVADDHLVTASVR